MSARRAALVHLATLLLVGVGYLVVRVVVAPTGGFLRSHATDLLAGVALPALLALVIARETPLGAWVRTLGGKLATVLAAALVWEVAVPLFTPRSTPDLLDVASYVAGALLQHAGAMLTARVSSRRVSPSRSPTPSPGRC